MILYLMRHGQTDWNFKEIIQGWTDTPLNEVGMLQAKSAAKLLEDKNIDVIYSSDLKRARKTAEIMNVKLDCPIHFTKRLRELNFGDAEGKTRQNIRLKYPFITEAFRDLNNPERYDVKFPNGETIGQLQSRFMKVIDKLLADNQKSALLVTHGILIRLFIEIFLKKELHLENAEILQVKYDKKAKKFKSARILK